MTCGHAHTHTHAFPGLISIADVKFYLQINQLQHNLGMKEELLQMWNEQTSNDEELLSDDTSFADLDDSRGHRRSETSVYVAVLHPYCKLCLRFDASKEYHKQA